MRGVQSLILSRSGLLSVLFIYVFIIFLILFFSGQILNDLSEENLPSRIIILPFAIVLPIFLFGTIFVNIAKLIKDTKTKKPGVTFKIKLIFFFGFVAFVAAIPQAFLSMNFIDIVTKSWLTRNYSEAVKGGLDIAISYYRNRLIALEAISSSPFLEYAVKFIPASPNRTWAMLEKSYPFLDSIQIVRNSRTIYFNGKEECKIADSIIISSGSSGLLAKETAGNYSILRSQTNVKNNNADYLVIFSSFLPENFDAKAEKLTSSYDMLIQLEKYQSVFRIIILIALIFFSLPIFLLSLMISFRLSDEVLHPIVQLEDAIRHVAEGDFSFRLVTRPGDNISILTSSFNQMIKELEFSRKKNIQSDKIKAWKEIAQRMAHEIKNPLTPIKLSAERIKKRYEAEDPNLEKIINSSVSIIIKEVERLTHLLAEFSNFARMPATVFLSVKPAEIINEVRDIFALSFPGIMFEIEADNYQSVIMADREKIKQVLINLFSNAIEAMNGNGNIYIRTDVITKESEKFYRIQITDTGKGIDKEDTDKIFLPYYTTREKGTGLGLAIVERIIFDHNGAIWFESEKGTGATFFIDLPVGVNDEQNSDS